MKAYVTFLTPPHYRLEEHEKSLAKATSSFRAALVKLSGIKSDAKAELAYSEFSREKISKLYTVGRKIAWPLLGIGKIADIIIKLRRGDMNNYNPMQITEEDIVKALTILGTPCHHINEMCREGIDHIVASLELDQHRPRSDVRHFFFKERRNGKSQLHQDPDFVPRFNSEMQSFSENTFDGLTECTDEAINTPRHPVFIVVFNKFLLCAVAEEISSLILLVDSFRIEGSVRSKRIVLPKFGNPCRSIRNFFHKRSFVGVSVVESQSLGRAKRNCYLSNSLTHRDVLETNDSLVAPSNSF